MQPPDLTMASLSSARADFALLDTFWNEPVERYVLPNGLTVILKPDSSSAIASVQVWVKTGSIHESTHLGSGVSHYLEHMLFKGTHRRNGREISATVQAHGGYINAYTTFDRTVYYIEIPSEHTAVAIDILADAVLNSTLPADEAAKEKNVILREIAMGQDDPDQRLGEALFETAFREHPYRQPIIGHRDVFSALTPEDLTAYYRSRYVPNNLVVVIVGDISTAAVRADIEKHFGATPRSRLEPLYLPEEPPAQAPRDDHRYEAVEVSRAGLAWPIPGLTHPDAAALDLLAMVLGNGDSSVLWQEIREKKNLAHAIDATSWNPGTVGLFYISFTADGDKRLAATNAVHETLARYLKNGFTAAQLKKAVRQLVVCEINTRKTMSGQASRLGSAEVVVGDLDYSRTYFEQAAAVTPADLKRVLKTYLVKERLTAVSINPAASKPSVAAAVPVASKGSALIEVKAAGGARLVLLPDRRLPNLHLRVCFLGGPLQEEADKRGATALLATMLTKDTKKRSAAAVSRHIEEVGGVFQSFSGNNSFGLAIEVLPGNLDRALSVLEEALLSPAFKAPSFEIEREAQLAGLLQDADDVVTYARKTIRRKFFGEHPLGVDAQGDETGLKAISVKDLQILHRRLVVAGNSVLVAAGDFDPKFLAPKLKALLAKLPSGTMAPKSLPFISSAAPGATVETQPRQQAVVLEAYAGPTLLAEDFYAGEVADELFSGMSSRLFERVREEKGLAYFVRSARVTGLDAAMFSFFAGTAPGKEDEVLAEIEAEVERVKNGGVEASELLRCQTRLKAARRMSLQTNGARAMQAGLNLLYRLPADDWKNYDRKIDAVTIKDLQNFAVRYFKRSERTRFVVRPHGAGRLKGK